MSKARVKTWAIVSDVHFPEVHWPTWRCFRAWLADRRPHGIVFGGDMFDLESMSRFEQSDKDPAIIGGLRIGVREMNDAAREVEIAHFVEGNHEHRYFRKIAGLVPRHVEGLVGLSLEEQCRFQGLDPRIVWHTERPGWQGVPLGHAHFRHGHADYPKGGPTHVAANLVDRYYASTIIGHTHRQQLVLRGRPNARTEWGATNPTMQLTPTWDPRAKWSRGWTVVEVDAETGYAHPYPVICEAGRTALGGVVYEGNDAAGSVGAALRERPARGPRVERVDGGQTAREIADATGIDYRTIHSRMERGVTGEALRAPIDERMRALRARPRAG